MSVALFTNNGLLQIAIYFVVLFACVKPLGGYMAHVYEGKVVWLDKPLGWLERLFYKACGTSRDNEMNWKQASLDLVSFSIMVPSN